MVHVFYHNIAESPSQEKMDAIFRSFPASTQLQILKFRNEHDRKKTILGKMLLTEALKELKLDYGLGELKYSSYRRPYFDDSFDFNISHSQNFVVCAFSNFHRVGIDIENIKPVNFCDFQNDFSYEDWKSIMEADNQLQMFYLLWTKKESLLKAIGTGFYQSTSGIDLGEKEIDADNNKWSICQLELHPDYVCHLAVNKDLPEIRLVEIKFN